MLTLLYLSVLLIGGLLPILFVQGLGTMHRIVWLRMRMERGFLTYSHFWCLFFFFFFEDEVEDKMKKKSVSL